MKQFLTITEATEQLGRSRSTIERMVKEIQSYPERYDRSTNFFGQGRKVSIRTACLFDYDSNKELLETYPELAPRYNPLKIEQELGITENRDFPTAREIAQEVLIIIRGERK